MESVLEYIKPILYFVLLEAVLLNIIAEKGFQKLVKIFCGIVLILLVIRPIQKIMQITEEQISGEQIFTYDNENIMNQYDEEYKKLIEINITAIVEGQGMQVMNLAMEYKEENGITLKTVNLNVAEKEEERSVIIEKIDIKKKEESTGLNEKCVVIQNEIVETYGINQDNVRVGVVDR